MRTLLDFSDVASSEALFIAFDSARRKFKTLIPDLENELKDNGTGRLHVTWKMLASDDWLVDLARLIESQTSLMRGANY